MTVAKDTTVIDTIQYYVPVPKDSVVIRYITKVIPIRENDRQDHPFDSTEITIEKDTANDSFKVHIPITQKEYITQDYKAYVSGYQASLDSINIYRHETTKVFVERQKEKKWSIGISAGIGATPEGMQPYIGISITRSLFRF